MPGIRVKNPIGTDWDYSLDLVSWQTSPVFTEAAPGVPLEADTLYVVYCRNQQQGLLEPRAIRFGQADADEDELDAVVKRGRDERKGWTNFLVRLMGGIMANLPTTTDDLDKVVINSEGMLLRQTATQSNETIFQDQGNFIVISDGGGNVPLPGEYRPAPTSPTSVLEGSNIKPFFQQKWSDGSWRAYESSYTLDFYGSVLAGITIDELSIYVAQNSLSANYSFTALVTFPGGYSLQLPLRAVNVDAGGNPPVLVNPMADTIVSQAGDQQIGFPAGQFTGGDSFTVRKVVNETVDEPLPTGITYDSATDKVIVAGTVANTVMALRKTAYNAYGIAKDDFRLDIERPTSVSLLAVDYSFDVRNQAGGDLNQLFLWIKIDNPASIEVAIQVTGPPDFALPKSSYSDMNTGDYGNGYTKRTIVFGALPGQITKLYLRKVGESQDLMTITLPALPSTDLGRTNTYTR